MQTQHANTDADVHRTLTRELMRCSRAITLGYPVDVDLRWLSALQRHSTEGTTVFPDEVLKALRVNVEHLSGGSFTVRRADPAMAPVNAEGPVLWAVRCPINTPHERVVFPTVAMDLFLVSPTRDGFSFGYQPRSDDSIREILAERTIRQQRWQDEHQRQATLDREVIDQLGVLTAGIQFFYEIQKLDPTDPRLIDANWRERFVDLNVVQLLELCAVLGVDLSMVLQQGNNQ